MSEPTRTQPPEPNRLTVTGGPGATERNGFAGIESPPGYELHGEIGSGGMGVVYRARDLELTRDVAVKILQPQFAPDSPTARRFVDEARITGRLQHPGIPAIYRVGSFPDGRPFLAMKLIAGRTLEDLLKNRTVVVARSDSPAGLENAADGMFDRLAAFLESGRFLAIFEHVAQAVAYAHEQGVIHRDLKPANIMVGAFGEVQVMDWGIAKSGERQGTGVSEAGAPLATVEYSPPGDYRTPRSDLTQAGAVLGTPAYMPPEQAIGAVDQIGRHSDVFGLGAILCVILTGKPPYAGADAESNRQLAARAKLDDALARLNASGAEPELIALAKRCLAPEPGDRPANAREVAEAVEGLRADAERRARQAEMNRARAEVKSSEERKRRRVQYALAFSVLGLFAIAGFGAWWIDSVRSQRRAEELQRDTERQTRLTTHERDVRAAFDEFQLRIREGHQQDDDPARWLVSLETADFALRRAESLLEVGEPNDSFKDTFADARETLARDKRDRLLILELNRIADSNEIRGMFPFPITEVTSRQFAAAFRAHGIDVLTVPSEEVVAWLKRHRLHKRLVIAIRNWYTTHPEWPNDDGIDPERHAPWHAPAAVAGAPPAIAAEVETQALLKKQQSQNSPRMRLAAILKNVTDDEFPRRWWNAVELNDYETLRQLVRRPELGQLSSRELSSFADGLSPFGDNGDVLDYLLTFALERFPGEFWVHLRKAHQDEYSNKTRDPHDATKGETTLKHLTAALAIRPRSGVARVALGMEMLDARKKDPAGLRMLYSAAEVDPSSPWPHIFIAMHALDERDWAGATRAIRESVRLDPDVGFFLVPAASLLYLASTTEDEKRPSEQEVAQFVKELMEMHPRYPGGYYQLATFYYRAGDYRAALSWFRKAAVLTVSDHPMRVSIDRQIQKLERQARWEAKLPAMLRGSATATLNGLELAELAEYCARFEKRFVLATRLAAAAIKADPEILDTDENAVKFAGWAVQASAGTGVDAADLAPDKRDELRRQAYESMRQLIDPKEPGSSLVLWFYIGSINDFVPVRDPRYLAKLPEAERVAWEKLWREITPPRPSSAPDEIAPPPRERKE
jgi:eukaryotic-like serine/threonine-protein kinase